MTSDDLSSDLVWEKMWVGRPTDTHFSAGGSSPLARADDTNKLETHATLGGRVEDEDDESDLLKVAAGVALGVLVTIGAFKAAPHVKTWWKERRARKVALSEAAEPADEADTSDVATLAVAAFASEVEGALDEQRTKMSSAEAQRRVLEIMLAAAIIADNMNALSNAQLEDGASAELQSALERLTVPQVTDSLNRMLEADSTLLGEQASAELMKVFGGGCAAEGQYVPLRNDRIREVLRLPRAA
ncbi:hypothetical protein ACWCOV_08300 [Kribbella sp. NPDC002412]